MKTLITFIVICIGMLILVLFLDFLQHLGPTQLMHTIINKIYIMEREDYILAILFVISYVFILLIQRKKSKLNKKGDK